MKTKPSLVAAILSLAAITELFAQPTLISASKYGTATGSDEGFAITGSAYTGTYYNSASGTMDITIGGLLLSGPNGIDAGRGIVSDGSGNTYVTGYFYGTVDFGGTFLTANGTFNYDVFVAKYNSSWNLVWAKNFGGTGGDLGYGIAIDGSGRVYTTGTFSGIVDFDPGAGTYNLNSSSGTMFISMLDINGNFLWATQNSGVGSSITIDGGGNYYAVSANSVYKYSPSGSLIWAKTIGATSIKSITSYGNKHLYLTGYFFGTSDFDPNTGVSNLTSAGAEDIFIEKLDTAGAFIWAKSMGGTGGDRGHSLTTDPDGGVYATGYFTGTADFDPGVFKYNLTSNGSNDIFVVYLDSSGTLKCAGKMGGSQQDIGYGITRTGYTNSIARVAITGSFEGVNADFDPSIGGYLLTSNGNKDVFIAAYDMGNCIICNPTFDTIYPVSCSYNSPSGNYIWTQSGTYKDTIINQQGCDSIITINLSANSSATINPVACETYTVPSGDETYTTSGTYMDTIPNSNGCDSVLTINLTVNYNTSATISPTACNNYTVPSGDETYAISGTYMDTIPNTKGCDSVLTINLIIATTLYDTISINTCQSYTVPSGDETYYVSGTFNDTLISGGGCDSVITINLTMATDGPGAWTQKANMGFSNRSEAIAFSINDTVYAGTGPFGYDDFYQYIPSTDSWIQKANFPGGERRGAVAFSIGSKGYICTGDSSGVMKKDLWEYNPSNDSWIQKADFGGVSRSNAVAFSIGNKGYVGTGTNDLVSGKKDFWEYDPSGDSWTQKADFGGTSRFGAVGFSFGNKGYIGTGNDGSYKQDFWEYDPAGDAWTQKTDFGGTARSYAVGFSIGNRGYLGTGNNGSEKKDFWAYRPENDSWMQITDAGSANREKAIGVSISDRGYIGTGIAFFTVRNDFWEFFPPVLGSTSTVSVTACNSYSVPSGDETYTANGTYTDTIPNAAGCDSIITINLTIKISTTVTISPVVCDSYTVPSGDETYITSGTYTDTIPNTAGCDSVITINLTVKNSTSSSTNITACDSAMWNGNVYSISGTYLDTIPNAAGCDSLMTLVLIINNTSNSTIINPSACNSFTVPSGDETYVVSGTYFDTLTNTSGCDSIIRINLTVNYSSTSLINPVACDSYTVPSGDETYTASGTYTDTIPTGAGCDSMITINLTINNSSLGTINPVVCDSYTVPSGDETYTASGTFMDTIPNFTGCDSIITIYLTVNNSTMGSINPVVCDSYTVPSGDETYTASGTFMDTIPNSIGCDSIITINLTIKGSTSSSQSVTACDSYVWNSNTYTISGTYTDTIPNSVGCDSVMTLNLSINASTSSLSTVSACDSMVWNGNTYNTSGTYLDTIPNVSGCDSVMTLNLTINSATSATAAINACGSYTVPSGDETYTASGTYTDTIPNAAGCDSIVTINLTINYSTTISISPVACDGYTVPSGDESYTVSGTYTDTIPNAAGCDSIITINLTIKGSTSSSQSITACDSYFWSSNTYTISGTYTDTIPNSVGCDSVMTLNLTINYSVSLNQNSSICTGDSLVVGSSVYSSTGTYVDTLNTVAGCDSIVTLNLTVNNSSSSFISTTACDSYTVPSGNESYTASGTYTDTIPNATGCDSIITISLTIKGSTSSSQSITACDSYVWSSNTYTISGTYTDTIPNSVGCDSVMTLNLTINASTSSTTTATACNSYTWNSNTYTISGTYTDTIPNVAGCDSVFILNLTINPFPPTPTITPGGATTFCQGNSVMLTANSATSYLWNNSATTQSITVSASGNYSVTVTDGNGCSATSSVILVTVNSLPVVTLSLNPDTVCINSGSYPLTGGSPGGGTYSGTGVSAGNFNPGVAGIGLHAISYSYADGNGCIDSSSAQLFVDLCTGVQGVFNSQSIVISPNPCQGVFFLNSTVEISSVEIQNILGEKIYSLFMNADQTEIDLKHQPQGIYFVKITSEHRIVTKKLIIH